MELRHAQHRHVPRARLAVRVQISDRCAASPKVNSRQFQFTAIHACHHIHIHLLLDIIFPCRTLVLEVSYCTQTQWLRPLNGSYAPSTGAPSFDTNFGAAADLPFSYICCKCSMICWTSALVRCLVRRSDGLNLFLIFTSVNDFSCT